MTVLLILGLAAACILVGLVHRQLARLGPAWPGAVVPVLWVATAISLVATGNIRSAVDVGGLLLVSVVIARIWHEGRQHRAARSAPAAARV